MNRFVVPAVVVLVLALGGAGLWWTLQPRGNGLALAGYVESQEVHLGSKIGGRVEKVEAAEGQTVEAGQTLVRLAIPERRAQLEQAKARAAAAAAQLERLRNGARREEVAAAQAAMEAARARLQKLEKGWREEELRMAKAELEAADADVKVAQDEMDRVRELFKQGGQASTIREFELARAALGRAVGRQRAAKARDEMLAAGSRLEDVAEAKAEFAKLEAQYLLLYNGSRKEDVAAAEAALKEAQAKQAEIEADCAEAEIKAPSRAFVEVVAVRPGDLVTPNQPIVRVLKWDDVWIKVFVPETQLGRIKKNQPAEITVDGYPGRVFKGRVSHISSIAEFLPRNVQSPDERRNQVFYVKVVATDPEAEKIFKPGMAASVTLPLQE